MQAEISEFASDLKIVDTFMVAKKGIRKLGSPGKNLLRSTYSPPANKLKNINNLGPGNVESQKI